MINNEWSYGKYNTCFTNESFNMNEHDWKGLKLIKNLWVKFSCLATKLVSDSWLPPELIGRLWHIVNEHLFWSKEMKFLLKLIEMCNFRIEVLTFQLIYLSILYWFLLYLSFGCSRKLQFASVSPWKVFKASIIFC